MSTAQPGHAVPWTGATPVIDGAAIAPFAENSSEIPGPPLSWIEFPRTSL